MKLSDQINNYKFVNNTIKAEGYRNDVEGLRAVAVLLVIFYHLGLSSVPGGFVGVDVFFVISGYLITKLIVGKIGKDSFSVTEFYRRRFQRLLPALFAVLISTTAVALYVLPPQHLAEFALSLSSGAAFSANLYFWQTSNYFSMAAETMPLLHIWSLSVEEQIYLFFPFIMLWLCRKPRQRALIVVVTLLLASLILNAVLAETNPIASFYLMPTRAWEFLIGAIISFGRFDTLRKGKLNGIASASGLLLIIGSAVTITGAMSFYGLYAIFPCIGTFLVIVAGSHNGNIVSTFLATPILRFIGKISYSLYLWHWPMIAFLKGSIHGELSTIQQLTIFVASFLLSVLTYFYVEQPFRQHDKFRKMLSLRIGILFLTFLVAGGITIHFLASKGTSESIATVNQSIGYPRYKHCSFEDLSLESLLPCSIGDIESKKVALVWGDSHVLTLIPMLNHIAKLKGWRVVLAHKLGCPSLFGVRREDPKGVKIQCNTRSSDRIKELLLSGNIDYLFMISRWKMYEVGYYQNGRLQENETHFLSDEKTESHSAQSSAKVLDRAIRRTLNTIVEDIQVNTAVMIGIPEPPVEFNSKDRETPSLTRDEYEQSRKKTLASLRAYGDSDSLTILDPIEYFCSSAYCQRSEGDLSFYIDDNHLSKAGALKLLPLFEQAFDLADRRLEQ